MKFPQPVRRYGPRVAASAIAAVGLTTFAVLPSAAAPDFQATFKKLDVNGDGVLSADEFAGAKPSGEARDVVVETRIHKSTDGAAPPAAAKASELKQDAFTFWLPDELGAPASDKEQHQYKVITKHEIRTDEDSGDKAAAPSEITFSIDDFRKKEFESFDGDRDGKVSYTEYSARQRAMMTRGFEILDANGDKSLSQDEYARIVSPPMPRIGDGDDADAPKVSIQGGPKVSPEALKAAFIKLDINKDNKLSLQEYLPPA